MAVTITGKKIVAGDVDVDITWTGLGYDWNGNGYTLKVKVVAPDGTSAEHALTTVVGETLQAFLSSISGVFTENGRHTLQLLMYSGGSVKRRSSPFPIFIDEAI